MSITKSAKWSGAFQHRGIVVYRRLAGTGTTGGQWMTDNTHFTTKKAALAYLDGLPAGTVTSGNHVVGPPVPAKKVWGVV